MSSKTKKRWFQHLKKTDALAAAQLAAQTTRDIVEVTEQVHLSILDQVKAGRFNSTHWLQPGTRLVYLGVKVLPVTTQALLNPIANYIATLKGQVPLLETEQRRNITAALNGLFGDQFEKTQNPLLTHMQIIRPANEYYSRKLLFIHGLCMDERAWNSEQVDKLAAELQADIWLLRYNTGINIEENGKRFAHLLSEAFSEQQENKNFSVSIIGHSMGGLVALNALAFAQQQSLDWFHCCKALVTLGTPFAGAPTARVGSWAEATLARTPFTQPFVKLTQRRSEGIKNLHEGFTATLPNDFPTPVYCIAGTLKAIRHKGIDALLGDGLVSESSAFGAPCRQERWVAKNVGHLKLCSDEAVFEKIESWLGER